MFQSRIDANLYWLTADELDAWRDANPGDARGDWVLILPDPEPIGREEA